MIVWVSYIISSPNTESVKEVRYLTLPPWPYTQLYTLAENVHTYAVSLSRVAVWFKQTSHVADSQQIGVMTLHYYSTIYYYYLHLYLMTQLHKLLHSDRAADIYTVSALSALRYCVPYCVQTHSLQREMVVRYI